MRELIEKPATDEEWRALFMRWLDATFHLRYGRARHKPGDGGYPTFRAWAVDVTGCAAWEVPERYR